LHWNLSGGTYLNAFQLGFLAALLAQGLKVQTLRPWPQK
jgi:hypothetical protein